MTALDSDIGKTQDHLFNSMVFPEPKVDSLAGGLS